MSLLLALALLILPLFPIYPLFAQGNVVWSRTYGGREADYGWKVIKTTDGGFALAASTRSFGAGGSDMWFIRADSAGEVLQRRTYGGREDDNAFTILQTTDGGFLLAGSTISFGAGGDDFWIIRTDENGDSIWSRIFGGGGDPHEFCVDAIQTSDGGFVLAGYGAALGAGGYDFWLLKVNDQGDSLWLRTYGERFDEYCTSMIETEDGGFVLAGYSNSFSNGDYDIWMVRTDDQGNILWSKTFGSDLEDYCYEIIQATDGGFTLAGSTLGLGAGGQDIWLIHTDQNGDSLWSRTYGGINDDICTSIVLTSDGGYALIGTTFSFGGGWGDYWFLRTNENGELLWAHPYGSRGYDWGQCILPTDNGEFVLVGHSESFGAGDYDIWLLRIKDVTPHHFILPPRSPLAERHQLIIENIRTHGDEDPAFWEVGIFTQSDVLAGAAVWRDEPTPLDVYGDDEETEEVEGFVPQERMVRFKLWDFRNNREYYAIPRVQEGDLNWQPDGTTTIELLVNGDENIRHFNDFTFSDSYHLLTITDIVHRWQTAPSGWEVGIFTSKEVLASGGLWRQDELLTMKVWGDDESTEEIEGFTDGEAMTFRVWDRESNREYPATPATPQEGEVIRSLRWRANGNSEISLLVNFRTLKVQLEEGWNLISLNIHLYPAHYYPQNDPLHQNPRIEQVLAQTGEWLLFVKNEDGRFWSVSRGFQNLFDWNFNEGYQVRLARAVEAEWEGFAIDPQEDLPIRRGWNFIAYFPTYPLPASAPDFYVVSPILQYVIMAKDRQGRFMRPSANFSNMEPWREGQGYQIKVSADVVLNYPPPPQELQLAPSLPLPSQPHLATHWQEPEPTGINMSLLITSFTDLEVSEGDQVAAVDEQGRVVGVGWVQAKGMCGLAVWGDDPTTERVEGLRVGEGFTLKLWSAQREEELPLEGSMVHGQLSFEPDGYEELTATPSPLPTQFYINPAYPNPFNSSTRITFGLPEASEVNIRVFTPSGQEVALLAKGKMSAGHHSLTFNGERLAAGIYLVEFRVGQIHQVQKVALMK